MIETLTIIDQNGMREIKLADFESKGAILGRNSKEADISIASPFVSSTHAQIIMSDNKVYLVDTNSRNGIRFQNNGQVFKLKPGVPFEIKGNHQVFWIGEARDNIQSAVLIFGERTEGIWRSYGIESDSLTIGRSEECNIVVNHVMVSRKHAIVVRQNDESILYDNKSKNGVLINGELVREQQKLCENDLIMIAGSLFIYRDFSILFKSAEKSVDIELSHVNKKVSKNKLILNDVSCHIQGGEFVAIIGGSGAGKTTVMNAMSGFDNKVSGCVTMSGIDVNRNFNYLKDMIGFVPQQDIIYENLKLRKMLYYTALLKMPEDYSEDEITRRITEVLEMVDLSEHQDTYIRKLSGGQKKRASIAVELLADPKVFFLDEPTSGLDSGTEKSLMQTLRKLSDEQGKTIVMVTHTTQNLGLCDKIMVMGKGGRICYCGSPEEINNYFQVEDIVDVYVKTADNSEYWNKVYKHSCFKDEVTAEETRVVYNDNNTKPQKASAFKQFTVLARRYAELIKNDFQRSLLMILQPILIGLLLGLVAADNIFFVYEDTKSIMFALVCSVIWLGLFNTIQEICKERVILKREFMSNLRLGAYLSSKYSVQIVICLFQVMIIMVVAMLFIGTPGKGVILDAGSIEMFVTLFLTIVSSAALGFAISTFAKNGDRAMAIAPFVLILQLLFSGILFDLSGVTSVISMLTISRWSIEAIGNTVDLNSMDLRMHDEFPMLIHESEAMFEHSINHLMQSWVILLSFIFVLFVISRFVLKLLKNDGR